MNKINATSIFQMFGFELNKHLMFLQYILIGLPAGFKTKSIE